MGEGTTRSPDLYSFQRTSHCFVRGICCRGGVTLLASKEPRYSCNNKGALEAPPDIGPCPYHGAIPGPYNKSNDIASKARALAVSMCVPVCESCRAALIAFPASRTTPNNMGALHASVRSKSNLQQTT